MSKFLLTSVSKWINPKEFEMNRHTSNSLKGCVLEADLEYPKKLHELHNDYPFAQEKIEIKREMLSNYRLKIDDLYDIPIVNVKRLMANFFDKKVCASL